MPYNTGSWTSDAPQCPGKAWGFLEFVRILGVSMHLVGGGWGVKVLCSVGDSPTRLQAPNATSECWLAAALALATSEENVDPEGRLGSGRAPSTCWLCQSHHFNSVLSAPWHTVLDNVSSYSLASRRMSLSKTQSLRSDWIYWTNSNSVRIKMYSEWCFSRS